MLYRAISLFVLTGYVAAQIPNLSSDCTAALISISADKDASTCLATSELTGLALGNAFIDTVDGWLNTMCPAAPCSNATLTNVVNILSGGCPNELANLGIGLPPDALNNIVQTFYPTVREIACLKEGNQNCVTQTLLNLQSVNGSPLTPEAAISAIGQAGSLPTNVTCTNCVKAAYNVVAKNMPQFIPDVQQPLQDKCGASFVDGNFPSGITQSAANSASNSSSSPSSSSSAVLLNMNALSSIGLSGLVAVSSIFAIVI